ncbi:MAG: histidine phosphatase family protein [Bacteroidales bacterium]|jgi:hypothetical protein|nr:histidine phosphatase family protein [Bacteroidales bacterium]
MKKVLRIAGLVLAALAISLNLCAQNAKNLLKENPERAAGVYHSYEIPETTYSQSPKGYEPFYISHYGRHGSRYHTSTGYFSEAIDMLDKAYDKGLLTKEGKELRDDVLIIENAHKGMSGYLTQKGGKEQQGLAQRMYERFPEVFNQKKRREINCISSTVPRCILSMTYFTNELKGLSPKDDFHFDTGDKYMPMIAHSVDIGKIQKGNNNYTDSLREAEFNPERLDKLLFKDTEKANKLLDGNTQKFYKSVYMAGAICQDLDMTPPVDIFRFFNADELFEQWKLYNIKMYSYNCDTKEYDSDRSQSAVFLLKDITERADAAVKGNDTAADLRFGHDTGLLPLVNLMKIEGQDSVYSIKNVSEHWFGFESIPMASNLQIIFYRNKANSILVKLLYNEKETGIPALKAYEGRYYKWTDLREYFKKLYSAAIPGK